MFLILLYHSRYKSNFNSTKIQIKIDWHKDRDRSKEIMELERWK